MGVNHRVRALRKASRTLSCIFSANERESTTQKLVFSRSSSTFISIPSSLRCFLRVRAARALLRLWTRRARCPGESVHQVPILFFPSPESPQWRNPDAPPAIAPSCECNVPHPDAPRAIICQIRRVGPPPEMGTRNGITVKF